MRIQDLLNFLESKAPGMLQESYDNSGLLVGDPRWEATGVMICLDSTEEVIEEAIAKKCNVVLAHHPIIFSGLKRITGKNYIERAVIKAIKNDIAIISCHTNLDHVQEGVNHRICAHLCLIETRILSPKKDLLQKLSVYVPDSHLEAVETAVFTAGAGQIGSYSECSFTSDGQGSFKGNEHSNPRLGARGKRETVGEKKLEVIVPVWKTGSVLEAMKQAHLYEEVAYDLIPMQNVHQEVGSGMIGRLEKPMATMDFLNFVKNTFQCGGLRYTTPVNEKIQTVAVCGGSGSFLLDTAIRSGADVLVTSDFKYHQFFDADGRILIADIGHFETEQYTIDLLFDWFAEKFPTFASHKTGVVTNPINYL